MIGPMASDILQQYFKSEHIVNSPAIEVPGQKAAYPFAQKLGQPRGGQRSKMRIGQMRKLEHAGGAPRLTVEDSDAIEARSLRVTVLRVQAS